MDLLQDHLVKLRALEPEDVDILYRWENDTDVWRVSNTVTPFSKYVLQRFIEEQSRDIYETRQLRLIIESLADGKPVGAIDLFDIDPYNARAGVGVLIYNKSDRKQGYASEALSLLIRYGFQVLCLNQLYCDIPYDNQESLALFKKKGFSIVGLKREWTKTTSDWQDEYMLQLLNPSK